ncbi:MAG TPA: TetR/AcrR family transcriptional regulator [Ilumatobacter sp.]|nr:TetR/AcrR family transcriptional regulator [Ilumatobacter sp.]
MPAHRVPPLSLDEIVSTAVALTAARGLDDLSMRTLAGELGVTAMTVHHHVGDKQRLVELVADAIVAGVSVPDDDLPWDVWLATYHDALWKQLRGFAGVARHLLDQPSNPAGAAIRRQTVGVLLASGFGERDALLAASTFHTHLLGRLAIEADSTRDTRADEPDWRAHGLTADDYVRHGLETILAGLRIAGAPTNRRRH